jgi:hypothetical protein
MVKRTTGTSSSAAPASLSAWSKAQSPSHRATCDALHKLIQTALPKATAKVWHGAPVWFLGENPVVGYSVKTKGVSLLFWNGQAFKEPGLVPVGKHGAAEALFLAGAELDSKTIRRWLKQAGTDVLDSKTYFRKLREGRDA